MKRILNTYVILVAAILVILPVQGVLSALTTENLKPSCGCSKSCCVSKGAPRAAEPAAAPTPVRAPVCSDLQPLWRDLQLCQSAQAIAARDVPRVTSTPFFPPPTSIHGIGCCFLI